MSMIWLRPVEELNQPDSENNPRALAEYFSRRFRTTRLMPDHKTDHGSGNNPAFLKKIGRIFIWHPGC